MNATRFRLATPRRARSTALFAALLSALAPLSPAQAPPAAHQTQESPTLAGPLNRAKTGQTVLNFLYVHGMGIDPPKANSQDFQVSLQFRKSLCKMIRCTTPAGELQSRDYAGRGVFARSAPPLKYLGEEIWKSGTADWPAAAPFVDHYKLQLTDPQHTLIYLHEINWWPLVFSAKCRQIVAKEAALVDPDKSHIATCSVATVPDATGHFKSYAWITPSDVEPRQLSWPPPALLNRSLKRNILDWGFADALLSVGPMHTFLIEGIREIILDSYHPDEPQEFVVVSHSLGSYLVLSALDLQNDSEGARIPEWKSKFEKVLTQTSHAFFMANQVRLLELANLELPISSDAKRSDLITHLAYWSQLRRQAQQTCPEIVAWSDPNDLLTWKVPDLDAAHTNCGSASDVSVDNRPAKNAWDWFGLVENPEKAHINYDQNKAVVRAMLPKSALSPQ